MTVGNFRLLWAGEGTSAVGSAVTQVTLPFVAATGLGASTLQVSLLTVAAWLPWLAIGLPAGAWVDRLPRRKVLLTCDGACLLLLTSVGITAWVGSLTYLPLLAVALALGVLGVFFQTACHVFVSDLVVAEDLARVNAKLQGSDATAQIAGPGLAGLLTQAVGPASCLLFDAATYAVSAVCLSRIHTEDRRAPVPNSSLRAEMHEGLRFLAGDPYLRTLAGYGAACNFALTGYQSLLVVFLLREVGTTPAIAGLLISGMGAGGLLGAVSASKVGARFGSARGMQISSLVAGPFALLLPLTAPGSRLALVVIGGGGLSAAVVIGNVLKNSFRQAYTPRPLLGRVLVGMQFVNYGAMPLGALVAGVLATLLGVRQTMWIMTATLAVAPLVLLLGPAKRHRDFPSLAARGGASG